MHQGNCGAVWNTFSSYEPYCMNCMNEEKWDFKELWTINYFIKLSPIYVIVGLRVRRRLF